MSNTTEIPLNYLTLIPSHFNYINKSLINVHDRMDYNIINTNSIFYFLKYQNRTMCKDSTMCNDSIMSNHSIIRNDNTISNNDKTDK